MLVLHLKSNPYPHSASADGKISSICPRCDLIIGCSTWEAELERMEAAHICSSGRRNRLQKQDSLKADRRAIYRQGLCRSSSSCDR